MIKKSCVHKLCCHGEKPAWQPGMWTEPIENNAFALSCSGARSACHTVRSGPKGKPYLYICTRSILKKRLLNILPFLILGFLGWIKGLEQILFVFILKQYF